MTFQGSTGWPDKFISRYGIEEKIISDESMAVSEVDSKHFRTNVLPSLLKESKYIFKADEFSLFFVKCSHLTEL